MRGRKIVAAGQLPLYELAGFLPPEYIRDRDCTILTPVIHGAEVEPIYGKGVNIKPRVPGRLDSEHFRKILL